MKLLSLELKILTPFFAALIIFAGAATLYLDSANQLLAGSREQVRLEHRRRELHDALRALIDAETGQRGFIVTGLENYLEPYRSGVAEVDRHLDALDALYAGSDDAVALLAEIRRLRQIRLRKLDEAIAIRRQQGFEAARAAVLRNRGKVEMDQIRQQFATLLTQNDARESDTLARLSVVRETMWQRLWLLFGLMGAMLMAAYWVIFREVRQRHRLSERLKYEATHDGLTGLPNRRFFNQWLERQLAQARREGQQLALLYLDLDGFKRVNDSLGHEMGDRLLRVATQRFQQNMRGSDLLARLGGDEFAILTHVTAEPEGAGVLANRLIESLRDPLLPQYGRGYPVGVSIGIALYPRDALTPDALMHAADEAMYAAKQAGRNCHRFYGRLAAGAVAAADETSS